jgi:hypothetical protein
MRRAALIVLFAVIPLASHAQSPRILSHWVQLEAGGAVEARAVVEGTSCPKLIIDGQAAPMAIRAAASAEFAQVCAGSIPDGARSVAMADAVLPLPLREPERILVFGDTGCRIKGSAIQACNDPKQWPFPVLAAAAAKLKPDLVIHVGDYLYRENACPSGNAGCAGTPFGDNWPTWNADFFGAAQPLLSVAPAVFVRGNHEDCQRAGIGWMRMLGPYPYDPAAPCSVHQPPYTAHVSGAILGIVDNASAPDTSIDANAASNFHDDIAALASLSQPLWLVMHKPIWGVVSGPLGLPVGGNATMISAVENREHTFPSPVKLMLTGHIHAFQAINYKDAIPPQIIAGRGGTKLDTTPADLRGAIFQGSSVAVKDGLSVDGFGFLLMTKLKDRWTIDLYDAGATYERQCVFAAGRVDCPMPPK